MITDADAWVAYPQHHKWFNKLYVAEQMEYLCGPAGVAPPVSDYYIVRPIYNLGGMGVGASVQFIEAGNNAIVPPGYFWCEILLGKQYSATYKFDHGGPPFWIPISCWEATRAGDSYTKYISWTRSEYIPPVPRIFNALSNVQLINIEFRGDKPFEVHLRDTPDPDYDILIPVWEDTNQSTIDLYINQGFRYISSFDDSNGFLKPARLGFMVK